MHILMFLFVLISAILLFSILINMNWCVKTIRNIAKNECGYTKLIQMGLICLLCFVFLSIVFYYFLNPSKVDRIDIILTVVVGWLGAIIGKFFGEKAMGMLEDKQKFNVKEFISEINRKDFIISRLLEKLKKE